MKRTLIFGAGGFGREILVQIRDSCKVIGFLDNDLKRIGEIVDGVKVLGNAFVTKEIEFEEVVLGTPAISIVDQLVEAGIARSKINTEMMLLRINARLNFLRDFATECKKRDLSKACVAEGGIAWRVC